MPRLPADNERLRAAQRERILDAAAAVFARRGLAGTRIEDVAKAAQVSHGLVHHYFATKAELHRALVERVMGNADALPRAAAAQPGTAWQRLEWYVRVLLHGAASAPDAFFFVTECAVSEVVEPATRARIRELGQVGVRLLGELVAEGQREGAVRAGDPEALAAHVLAAAQGLALAPPAGGIDPDIVLGLLRAPVEVP